jgi:hypothetical protein
MVYRYQNALRDDEKLLQTLACLRSERRRIGTIATACLCALPFFLARFEENIERYLLIGVGCLVLLLFTARFAIEHRIVRNWAAAVGTVIWFQKIQGRRRGAAIKYLFRASDGTLHLGNTTGSMRLAKENKTLGIIYSPDNPSRSMLLSQFWFYDFSPVAAHGEANVSEAAPRLKANS